jgi:hypothetical protein
MRISGFTETHESALADLRFWFVPEFKKSVNADVMGGIPNLL